MGVVPSERMVSFLGFINVNTETHEIKEENLVENHLRTCVYLFFINFLIFKDNLFLKLLSKFNFFLLRVFSIVVHLFSFALVERMRTSNFSFCSNENSVRFNELEVKV